jgi:methyl-accepting chemotaxis protein
MKRLIHLFRAHRISALTISILLLILLQNFISFLFYTGEGGLRWISDLVLGGFIFGLSVLLGLRIIRLETSGISVFTRRFEKLGRGDLTCTADPENDCDHGILANAFNTLLPALKTVITELKSGSARMADSSRDISKSASVFSMNTQMQAASTEQISNAVSQARYAIKTIAEGSSNQTGSLASLTGIVNMLFSIIDEVEERIVRTKEETRAIAVDAQAGENLLFAMKESASRITDSSLQMKYIVEIITGVSDRINLLSLNSSIEAARAGAAGKGFSVIAAEISKLAVETARSTNDIEELIRKNDDEIRTGAARMDMIIAMLRKIAGGIGKVSAGMGEIDFLLEQQSSLKTVIKTESNTVKVNDEEISKVITNQDIAIRGIAESIAFINSLFQENAARAQEIESNCELLSEMAENFRQKSDFFRTGD